MKRKLKVNDFFCGCGGMGIAFKNAGYEIAGAWDFDKYAVKSYRANVGDHVQKADIKELHQADIPQADVWAFGFPCQDLSVAGKQRGMILKCEDCGEEIEINPEEYTGNTICPKCSSNNFKAASRSGCFFEMMRLLEETERERENTPCRPLSLRRMCEGYAHICQCYAWNMNATGTRHILKCLIPNIGTCHRTGTVTQ